ncbi:hypothetical protein SERLADRAFT_404610 [Serpula lacrymans var. lacrymans S7.9]|uniref:Uncharacterized protein n=1 Tax=Serpula lacrymans var. lacrymans (strain S7.9) TaxID=578457 RepID=F8NDX2_SERL9|nr:uncharacterized protein SERLADRAFT_404610 [Serpula lacrymans var. lacrymans S7.9]EGO30446.1 hypothetical protein SERLADRAFT_404610 [Serpula lacrymans var. lacrymans S7.9]
MAAVRDKNEHQGAFNSLAQGNSGLDAFLEAAGLFVPQQQSLNCTTRPSDHRHPTFSASAHLPTPMDVEYNGPDYAEVDSDNNEGDVERSDKDELYGNISDELEVILWLLQQNGVSGTSLLAQTKKMGWDLDDMCSVEIKQHMGCLGHTYYMIRPESLVKLNFSNPMTRSVLKVYPEDSGTVSNEICQAHQWLYELDSNLTTPMYRIGSQDFYIHEPALLNDNTICFWPPNLLGQVQQWTQPLSNPWRTKAGGAQVVAYPVFIYCDDTSGNQSKKWNEHNSFLMSAAGLPREHLHREYNLHFLYTSNAAPSLEMLEGVVNEILACQDTGIWAYDCVFKEVVLVIISVLALLGDNPMHSEFACHAGLQSKFFCRCCWVKGKDDNDMEDEDGNHPQKETIPGMVDRIKQFIKGGKARDPAETKQTSRGMFQNVVNMAPQKDNQLLQASTGVKDTVLQHFFAKLDKVSQYGEYKVRLSSLDVSGLDPSILRLWGHTLVQYAGLLVGRDFYLISQVAVFVLYDLLDEKILNAWAALCVLAPLVWQPDIDDKNSYFPHYSLLKYKNHLIALFVAGRSIQISKHHPRTLLDVLQDFYVCATLYLVDTSKSNMKSLSVMKIGNGVVLALQLLHWSHLRH